MIIGIPSKISYNGHLYGWRNAKSQKECYILGKRMSVDNEKIYIHSDLSIKQIKKEAFYFMKECEKTIDNPQQMR